MKKQLTVIKPDLSEEELSVLRNLAEELIRQFSEKGEDEDKSSALFEIVERG